MKSLPLALPVVLLLATLMAGFFLVRFLEKVGMGYLREQSESVIEAMTAGIQNDMRSSQEVVDAMVGAPWIYPALLTRSQENIARANAVLDRYQKSFYFEVAYLMDINGLIIASSNRNEPTSLVGANYAFRPYFKEALKGGNGLYMALGITTKTRGFYVSRAVRDPEGRIVGVVVVKKDIEASRTVLAGHPNSFFINPDGIVFISGSKGMVFKTLWPVSNERARAIQDSKQFGKVSFDPVFSKPLGDNERVQFRGESYQSFRRPLGPTGWSLVLLFSLESVFYFALFGWIVTGSMIFIIILLATWAATRFKAGEVLRESQERFRAAFESSGVGMALVRPEGQWLQVNPALCCILGYSEEELQGKTFRDITHPEDLEANLAQVRRLLAGEFSHYAMEKRYLHKDGHIIWVLLTVSLVRGAREEPLYFLTQIEDITERKKAEMELRKFQRAIEQSPVTVAITDLTGALEYVNPKFMETTGYAREEALGKNPRILKSGELSPRVYKELWETISSGKEWRGEFHNKRKNGELYWEFASISPIRDAQGTISHFLAVKEDITERKRAEEAMQKQTQELEIQSRELQKANDGIKILYQELEKKNVDLVKLDRLKNDFVSIVAHELRNPLSVVREAAALILDGLAGPVVEKQKKYIEMIKNTGDRLIHITNDLLDLARIEAGKIVVNYETMDLVSLARQCSEGISLRAHKKGLTVLEDFPSAKLEILGDFDKLSQVMINLLSNAFKFTEKGGITVEVRDLGEEVWCAVKDTGPGISEENLTRLFSKFEQFGKPTTSPEKGSGLGLVISKSIIEAHDGRIWAESVPSQGSSFIFTLPKKPKRKLKLGGDPRGRKDPDP